MTEGYKCHPLVISNHQAMTTIRPPAVCGKIQQPLGACCVVCVICRYRRRIQDASRRRRVAKSERRIDKARLTPDAPSHAKRGKPGTRVAPEDEDDPPALHDLWEDYLFRLQRRQAEAAQATPGGQAPDTRSRFLF